MALPNIDLTWRSNVNQTIAASGVGLTTNRRVMRAIKDAFISSAGYNIAPATLWTVRYSCDSVTAGSAGDGIDRWTSDGALVWANAASAHSWIVLRQTAIAANFEICLSLEPVSAPGNQLTLVVSPSAGFTGGTTTARPTATDEYVVAKSSMASSGDATHRIHALQSNDGKSIYIFVYSGTNLFCALMIGVPKQPVSGWTNPSWVYFNSGTASLDSGTLAATATSGIRGRAASITMSMYATGEGVSNGLLCAGFTGPNDLSVESPLFPIGLACNVATTVGRHGVIYDLWWGLNNYAQGDTYPGDASRQYMQVGDVVVPNPTGVGWQFS